MHPQPRPRFPNLLAGLLLAFLAVSGCGSDTVDGGSSEVRRDAQGTNPYSERPGYADPGSRTAQAAADPADSADAATGGAPDRQRVFSRLAATPQGIWLTPEQYPAGRVAPFVEKVVAAAGAADEVPTFVVYGIPDRDCTGGFSGGGLPVDRYGPWIEEIATAASGGDAAVIVEPDALASALECDRRDERVRLVAAAVAAFEDAGVTTYVDGGHSHWVEPAELAGLLKRVGVDRIRGFATNVANYQSDDDERAYGEKLSDLLGGAHYVIDSGRNGNGSTDEWCNPPGRAYGTDPSAAPEGDAEHLDAYLWVKPPGESDGECGGGPPAGRFWPERALEMAASSGW